MSVKVCKPLKWLILTNFLNLKIWISHDRYCEILLIHCVERWQLKATHQMVIAVANGLNDNYLSTFIHLNNYLSRTIEYVVATKQIKAIKSLLPLHHMPQSRSQILQILIIIIISSAFCFSTCEKTPIETRKKERERNESHMCVLRTFFACYKTFAFTMENKLPLFNQASWMMMKCRSFQRALSMVKVKLKRLPFLRSRHIKSMHKRAGEKKNIEESRLWPISDFSLFSLLF